MKCEQARELIDIRVHGASRPGPAAEPRDPAEWAELDAHLNACANCRAELDDLRRVRLMLADAAHDRPDDAEVQAMWTAVQTALAAPSPSAAVETRGWWARNRLLFVPLAGTAAVLVIAFQIGNMHYPGSVFRQAAMFSHVDSSLPLRSAENIKGIGLSARVYGADDPSGWAVPVHPSQYVAQPMLRKAPPPPSAPRPSVETYGIEEVTPTAVAAAPRDRSRPRLERESPGGSPPALLRATQTSTGSAGAAPPDSESAEKTPAITYDATTLDYNSEHPSQPSIAANLKIIKTGELTLEVGNYGDAVGRVEQVVREKGGFVADGATREEAGGALVGRIVMRVSPERFEETFAALKGIGRVAAENVKVADVTAEYVDLEARIASLRITEERLRELIANKSFVDKIASLLEVEKELNRVRTEIEQHQGQLRVMADRVALSTIVVTVREPSRKVSSASLSVEVPTLDEAAAKLNDLLAANDGRLLSGKTSKRSDGTLMGTYQVETTLARFSQVLAGIESLGRIEERQVSDQQFNQAAEDWADRVKCTVALVIFERSRQLPSAALRVEVDGLEPAMKRFTEILAAHDAAMASNQVTRLSDGSSAAEILVRVPAGRFGSLFEALSSLGRVTLKTSSGETDRIVGGTAAVLCDISVTLAEKPREVPQGKMSIEVEAFETARRTLSQEIAQRQLQVLSSSSNQRNDGTWQGTFRLGVPAREMESFVSKLEGLGRVAARQISGLGLGDLSRIDPDALGVIELTIAEKSTLSPSPDETTASIRGRIRDALAGFYASVGLIAYGLVVLLPWLLLAGLLGWIITRIRGGAKRKTATREAA